MKPTFEASLDVEKLVAFLVDKPGATYAELGAMIGRQVQGRDRYVLESARRKLEKRGIFFVVERGVGLTRATNNQVATLSTSTPITKIRRVTKVAEKRQHHVDIQSLTSEDRLAFDVKRSVIAAIRKTTSKSLRTMLAKEIEKQDGGVFNINSVLSLPRHRRKEG